MSDENSYQEVEHESGDGGIQLLPEEYFSSEREMPTSSFNFEEDDSLLGSSQEEDKPESESQEQETEEEENSEQEQVETEGEGNESPETTKTSEQEEEAQEEGEQEETPDESKTEASELPEEYKKIFEPFKANGQEFQAKSAEEVIALMQKGLGFNRNMQKLKPNLKIVDMLQKKDMLSVEKLSYAIDLLNHDKSAISKLLQDAKINPLELGLDEDSGYKGNDYSVSDEEYNVREVLSELRTTEHGKRTINVVTQEWDSASKSELVSKPATLRALSSHMENGIYDKVIQEVQRERLLGNLEGMTDLQAYFAVGSVMYEKQPSATVNTPAKSSKPASNTTDKELAKRKAAAAAPAGKPANTSTQAEEIDIFALSSEEFNKLMASGKFK